jgi:acetyl-CoA acetyltransferase
MANRRVAIVGAATSDCGGVDDKTAFQLNFQGTTRALADAGIAKSEVDGFMSTTGTLPPIELAEYLGLRPSWVDSTAHGGSVWEFMVEHAAAAIALGLVDVVVLTYGSTARADLKKKLRMANLSFGTRGPAQFTAPFGHPVGSHYAMVARRHMHEFGTTIAQLAEVAVSTRYNAAFNPEAFYRDPITIDDVIAAPIVGSPDEVALLYPLRRRRGRRPDQ